MFALWKWDYNFIYYFHHVLNEHYSFEGERLIYIVENRGMVSHNKTVGLNRVRKLDEILAKNLPE